MILDLWMGGESIQGSRMSMRRVMLPKVVKEVGGRFRDIRLRIHVEARVLDLVGTAGTLYRKIKARRKEGVKREPRCGIEMLSSGADGQA